jgi:hypothetical protein
MSPNGKTRWEELALKASTETDNAKLIKIIEELCRALDEHTEPPSRAATNGLANK